MAHVRKRTWTTQDGEVRHNYQVLITYYDSGGRRRQRSFTARTRREAERLARQWEEQIEAAGGKAPPGRLTVQALIEEHFLPHCRQNLRPATVANYEAVLKKHILPRIGRERLERLSPAAINQLYRALLAEGVGVPTVRRVHAILHRAFSLAVKWGLALHNPAANADPPRPQAPELEELDATALRRLLEAARQDRLYPLWLLLALTGLRRGEACALRWEDIDLEAGVLTVRRSRVVVGGRVVEQEPKTKRSRRTIAMPPVLVDALRAWAVKQKRERLALGPRWEGQDYVFTSEEGKPLRPDLLQKRAWKRLLRAAGLPLRLRIHDLRHAHVTALLQAGVPVKTVQERVGHHSAAFTLDRYAHAVSAMDVDAAQRIEQIVLGNEEETKEKRQA